MEAVFAPTRLPEPVKEHLAKFDLNRCMTCGTCTNGCPVTGTTVEARELLRDKGLAI